MQGKALATATALLLAVAGCGGGSANSSSPAAAGETRPPVEQARAEVRQARREQRKYESNAGVGRLSSSTQGSQEPGAEEPWLKPHHDSGGGAAQFRVARGDNTVQEYGHEGTELELREAAASLHTFLDARVAHRWVTVCAYLSAGALTALEQLPQMAAGHPDISGCPQILRAFGAQSNQQLLAQAAQADVGALRIKGDQGFLLYRGAGGGDFVIQMVKEHDRWKVGSLEPFPLSG